MLLTVLVRFAMVLVVVVPEAESLYFHQVPVVVGKYEAVLPFPPLFPPVCEILSGLISFWQLMISNETTINKRTETVFFIQVSFTGKVKKITKEKLSAGT